ncbi:MAG: hypothetical protein GYA57_08125 [Myxococcales bacterium]|nr:hypothetical protein [Myxococcales bacterium]
MTLRCASWIVLAVFLGSVAFAGCGGGDDSVADGDADAQVDDAGVDVEPDVEPDAEADVEPDAEADVEPDVGPDVEPDGDGGEVPCDCTDDIDCDDGDPCNGDEQCVACTCAPGIPPADGAPCDDGDPCTGDDACTGGVCTGGTPLCSCVDDVDCAAYEDGDLCNGTLACTGGFCAVDPATVVVCDPGADTACLRNTCVPATGECAMTPAPDGTACDDGDACTGDDACTGGVCAGGTPLCACAVDADCAAYEDGDPCNGTLVCSGGSCVVDPATVVVCDPGADTACLRNTCVPATGECAMTPAPDGTACDDGDLCTTGGVCGDGTCTGTVAVSCDDHDVCTDDACDPATGTCTHTNNTAPCDDGNLCTTGDVCADGTCAGTVAVSCDDHDVCTDDACDPATGTCTHTNNTAPCDDGDACTAPDACSSGSCIAGPRLPDWYPDADGDTFGDRNATPTCAATAPSGHVADHTDCCDSNATVYPGQTAWFTVTYTCAGSSSASWDYNCNDTPDMRYLTTGGGCTRAGSSCVSTIGWVGSIIRTCGGGGSFVTACDDECRPVQEWTAQECH